MTTEALTVDELNKQYVNVRELINNSAVDHQDQVFEIYKTLIAKALHDYQKRDIDDEDYDLYTPHYDAMNLATTFVKYFHEDMEYLNSQNNNYRRQLEKIRSQIAMAQRG